MPKHEALVPAFALAMALAATSAWSAEAAKSDPLKPGRINVLHPNPQSIADGLRVGFVNVSSGNLTFQRRDIVVPGRRPAMFSRIHDSRIGANADFGPGWRLSLDEEMVVDGRGMSYVDDTGARYRFRAGAGAHLVVDPMAPRHAATRLTLSGRAAALVAGDGQTRLFERLDPAQSRWSLRRIEWPGGDWIELAHEAGRLSAVGDAEGEMLRVTRDAEGRVASVVDRHHRQVRYEYDRLGRLAVVRDLAGNTWSHDYDDANRLTAALGEDRAPYLRAVYDASGRVARTLGEAELAFEYGPERTVVADRTSRARHVFERASGGAVVGFHSTTEVAWEIERDDRGRVETMWLSRTAAHRVDARFRPHGFRPSANAPRGPELKEGWDRAIRFHHSEHGVAAIETASLVGAERRDYTYDGQGRFTGRRSSTGGVPTLQFEYNGRSVSANRPTGETEFEFRTAPDGTLELFDNGLWQVAVEHDSRGCAIGFHSSKLGSALIERDNLSRIVATQHPDGSRVRHFVDALGHRTRSEYGDGAWRQVVYNAYGDVDTMERADAQGRRISTRVRVVSDVGAETDQPEYGVAGFDANFVPDVRNPMLDGVPHIREAFALMRDGAGLLSAQKSLDSPIRSLSHSPEYRGLDEFPALTNCAW